MALFSLPMFFFSAYFYKHDPALVKRRLETKEKIGKQKIIMLVGTIVGLLVFLLPGFDFRFGWSRKFFGPEPLWLTLLAGLVLLASYMCSFWVMMVNSYASRTIQVVAEQQVISTGPYRIVRHPMYLSALVFMLAAPLVLGSYLALPAFAAMIAPMLVLRLLNEEEVLRRELPGYPEYCERTRYRLIPFVW
jgi:protein-S-isoprenylcysteine O-methyltransferase Ste14